MLRLFAILIWLAVPALADGLRIAVISDLNGSYGSTVYGADVRKAVERIIALRPDIVISTGDMVAGQKASPHLDDAQLGAMWTAFHATVTDPLTAAGVAVLPTPGNHDASAYGGFERERRAYDRTWTAHAPAITILDGERYPFRYAADKGGVLFVSLDVTTVGALPPEEVEWLDQILREEGPRHRATVVFSHLPLFPFAQGRESEIILDPELEAVLQRHGVDLYLSGHHHAYFPGVADGMLAIGQACLGAGARRLIGEKHVSPKAFGLIEIDAEGHIDERAYAAPDFSATIPLESLPRSIGGLVRRDLAGQ